MEDLMTKNLSWKEFFYEVTFLSYKLLIRIESWHHYPILIYSWMEDVLWGGYAFSGEQNQLA